MSQPAAPASEPAPPLSKEEVAAWLRQHPDFLDRHPEVLEAIELHHRAHGAASLVERQMQLLRDRNRQLERKLMELVEIARENEHLSTRLHHLALALLEADDASDVVNIAQDLLRDELKADFVTLRLIGNPQAEETGLHFVPPEEPALARFEDLFHSGRPLCGRVSREQLEWLFGDQADDIASAVLIPLKDPNRIGLLALGSRDPHRFHPGMGTLFLGTLGELLARALRHHLEARA